MTKLRMSLTIIIFLLTGLSFAAGNTDDILRVGIIPGEPFVIDKKHGKYEGIAIDLWRYIAEEEHYKYKFILLDEDVNEDLANLSKSNLDLIIGPISDTYDRHKLADLTSPYYINQIGIIIKPLKLSYWQVVKNALLYLFSPLLFVFILIFFIYINAFWFLDRKYNSELPQTYLAGIGHTFWMHLLRRNFPQIPKAIATRVIALFWLLGVALLVSSMTAILSSTLITLGKKEQSKIISLADINNTVDLAMVKGNKPINLVRRYNPKITLVPDINTGIDLLNKDKVDGVIYDQALAEYLIEVMRGVNGKYNNLRLSPVVLENDLYVFALPKNSKLYQTIDDHLIRFRRAGITRTICERYLEFANVVDCEF
jgi:polar amino acid transport system substrate-binding protein